MGEMNLGTNIAKFRKRDSITQEQLAEYMGVTKSSVSKWETGVSYPDICVLPRLAALFHISVDDLIGYEPQLTKGEIRKLYYGLAGRMEGNPQETLKECEELIRKYYSCFPFLFQMAMLLLNHMVLFEDKEAVLAQIRSLCMRIEKESDDMNLRKNSAAVRVILSITTGDYKAALELLGEDVQMISQEGEMIALCHQNTGNIEKANEIYQVCMYQHLLFFIQDSLNYMMLNIQNAEICDETIDRLKEIVKRYGVEKLHPYTATQLYFAAAAVFAGRGELETAEKWLEKLGMVIQEKGIFESLMQEDRYFNKVRNWIQNQDLGDAPPRGKQLTKQSMVESLEQFPGFQCMKERPGYKKLLKKIREL